MRMQCSLLYIGLAMMNLHSVDIPMEQGNYIQDGTILALNQIGCVSDVTCHSVGILIASQDQHLDGSVRQVAY